MEPLNSDDKNVYVTLPSGIKLVRKIYSRYSDKELKSIIAECNTISQMVTILKLHRCYHNNIKKFILDNKVSIDHFTRTYDMNEPIVINKQSYHGMKKRLLANGTLMNKCAICNLDGIWNNKPIVLQLDHINGDHYDNTISNLRILCPNCHAQTNTFGVKNTKKIKEKQKHDNEEIKSVNIIEDKSDYSSDESDDSLDEYHYSSDEYHYSSDESKPPTDVTFSKNKNSISCNACCNKLKKKGKTGLCEICVKIDYRVVERPSYNDLIKEVNENNFVQTGKKYGVSDNAIRKWIKNYEKTMT